jgi:hypothetical protein
VCPRCERLTCSAVPTGHARSVWVCASVAGCRRHGDVRGASMHVRARLLVKRCMHVVMPCRRWRPVVREHARQEVVCALNICMWAA